MQEDIVRGSFSCLAASVLLYMAAEHAVWFLRTWRIEFFAIMISTTILAMMEAWKVGVRVERVLGLR